MWYAARLTRLPSAVIPDVSTVSKRGAVEQILQVFCARLVGAALDPDLVAKATAVRTEHDDGSFAHREAFVAELSEQMEVPLQRDGNFLVGILPIGVDRTLAQSSLEEQVK